MRFCFNVLPLHQKTVAHPTWLFFQKIAIKEIPFFQKMVFLRRSEILFLQEIVFLFKEIT